MFILEFMEQVLCHDGIIRTWFNRAVFQDHAALTSCLSGWNGCPGPNGGVYTYWETPDQHARNARAPRVREPYLPHGVCHIHRSRAVPLDTTPSKDLSISGWEIRTNLESQLLPVEVNVCRWPAKTVPA